MVATEAPEIASGHADEAVVGRLLALVGEDAAGLNQRRLARDLGIALGAVNGHLRRCVASGFIEMTPLGGRRYAYALTAKGVAERNRLAAFVFTQGIELFRRARDSFDRVYAALAARGVERVMLCGIDELTEIAILASLGSAVRAGGIWRHAGRPTGLRGVPGVTLDEVVARGWAVVSVAHNAAYCFHALRRVLPAERVVVPDIVDVRSPSGYALGAG